MRGGPVGSLLVEAVRGDAWRSPSPPVARLAPLVDRADFALAAEYHGVPGYARAALLQVDADPALVDAVLPAYHRSLLHHLRALSDLTVVDAALRSVGAPYVVVKGPVLATQTHERADLRAYSDLDVLVPPPYFARAVASLIEAGCHPVGRAFHALIKVQAGELNFVLPSGGALDLHWHTLNSPSVRRAFRVDPAVLVGRSVISDVGGVPAPVLDRADTVLYVAMHAVLSGAHRLLWIKDVDQLLSSESVPWPEVAARAEEARAEILLALAIRQAGTVLGTRLPRSARRLRSGGSAWPWIAQVVASFSSPQDAVGDRRLLSRVAARSTRYGVPSSLRELIRRARAAGAPRQVNPSDQPADPDPVAALAAFTAWADRQ